ncbi:DUF3572 domain-containing protein [Aestuariivirga litoralis]|uniref:DUF3572 domain-containing protein n=1 Tax=Aestuariivirga litoralis TaxID=2650924 RepID=UPI0018C4C8BF|nr:DUF3572 domain-containing protein [Aestuariivirga litoralis]MBG1231363.1 DUF3572 domain-containing protein [Aestuariivirga litoralis]
MMKIANSGKSEALESLVASLIAFMTQDEDRFARFVGLTGLTLDDLRSRLSDPAFQAMVLDQTLEDESWVVEFAAAQDMPPDTLLKARRRLPGAEF